MPQISKQKPSTHPPMETDEYILLLQHKLQEVQDQILHLQAVEKDLQDKLNTYK